MRRLLRGKAGVTLVELMIAVALVTVGILGFIGAFKFITKSLHVSRTRTLATNLGQERIETLKNLSYYELLITTSTLQDNNFSPAIVYDNANYPAETVLIGGITFTRYTFVALAQFVSDNVSTVTYSYPDTGMKQIRTTVVWNDGGSWKKWTLTNLLENPNVAPLDANLFGTVYSAPLPNGSNSPLASALVQLEGFPDQQTFAAADGSYNFHVFHGSYTVRASSTGYWDAESGRMSAPEGTSTQVSPNPLVLSQIATGTIVGNAWVSSNVVISQVMVSSHTPIGIALGVPVFQDVEYIEFFNPTNTEFSLTGPGGSPGYVSLYYSGSDVTKDVTNLTVTVEVSSYIAPNHYFLLSNASFFMLNGQWMHSDITYSNSFLSLDVGGCAGLQFNHALNGVFESIIDEVSWDGAPCTPDVFYGYGLSVPGTLAAGNQIVRVSSPAASQAQIQQWGRAYNSGALDAGSGIGGNNLDFVYPSIAGYTGINIQPSHENTADDGLSGHTPMSTAAVVSGVPGLSAYVSASDPYSGSVSAQTAYISSGGLSLPYAPFSLVKITTTAAATASACAGLCWVIDIATSTFSVQISTVVVGHNVSTGVPNGSTVGSWPATNMNSAMMNANTGGFVEGNVSDINGQVINGAVSGVSISVGGLTRQLATNGDYFIAASSGYVTVIANPNFTYPYAQVIALPYVTQGQITTQNFILTQGVSINGYAINSSNNPIPNFPFVATQGGAEMGSATSDLTGHFSIRNLSTGTYTVTPALDTGKSSSPANTVVNALTPGFIFSSTFTIAGAMGTLTGTVKLNNQLVTTGALILASTASWPASVNTSGPPVIYGSSAPALTPMYAISSKADGTYALDVRGGLSYHMLIYIPSVDTAGRVTVSTGTPATQAGVGAGKTATYNISQ